MKKLLQKWLGIQTFEARLIDIERHFVTKRDQHGVITETLADVPFEKRKELKPPNLKGLSWHQQKAWLEKTDGGRLT
jgi:hypothetical protein